MVKMCNSIHCIQIISLAEFLSITIAIIGLFWVIDSLDSWKNQDAYYTSRDVSIEISELIFECDIGIFLKIEELPTNLSVDELRNNFKEIIPNSGIGSHISNLCNKIENENIYYKEDFMEIAKLLESSISKMWDVIENPQNNFHNIDSRLKIDTRNKLETAKTLNRELHNKLNKLISQ